MKNIVVVSLVLGLLVSVRTASAGHSDLDLVTVNSVSVSACGAQSVVGSGTASYSEPTQHLVVTLDGVQVLHAHDEPESWTTGSLSVGVGGHTLSAVIYDKIEGSGHEVIRAQGSTTFTVSACGSAVPASSSVGSSGASVGSSDCCPGPDVKVSAAQKGRIKGAASARKVKKLPLRAKPVNEIFRKVFKRGPTFAEWEYWTRRLLSDKSQYPALYGAMQWHQLRGHTTNK